ncbi:DSS1/SEM1 family-domain-containing protein [Phyllosticta paracitricarpa]
MSAPQNNNNNNNNNAATNNPSTADPKDTGDKATENSKPAAALEEDDEFEDFPAEDWATEDAELPAAAAANTHLWEESWDDDDTSEDFSAQLKYVGPILGYFAPQSYRQRLLSGTDVANTAHREELKKVDQKRA